MAAVDGTCCCTQLSRMVRMAGKETATVLALSSALSMSCEHGTREEHKGQQNVCTTKGCKGDEGHSSRCVRAAPRTSRRA